MIFALWSPVLSFVAVGRLLFLSKVIELAAQPVASPGKLWLIFGFNSLFALAFGASAYGLWTRRQWGRVLFIWAIIPWSGFEAAAIFMSGREYTGLEIGLNLLRPATAVLVSLWYLNIPRIKAFFRQ